ncbi:MAG: hypothetical protein V4795_25365 [Pseudomonadota bacterium]
MQNLIYLIIMALAGGAGWYAGSWKGRDAVEAVAKYQKLGEEAQAALQQAKTQLQTDLAAKDAKFDAELKQLTDSHAQQIQTYDLKIAGNAKEITRLSQVSAAGQTRIASLVKQRDAAATPEAKKQLDAQIQTAVVAQQAVEVEIDGRKCLPVPVPLAVLADWHGVKP